MKCKLYIEADGLAKQTVVLWKTEIEIPSGKASDLVIAIQKAVNRFTSHVNQDQNNKKAL